MVKRMDLSLECLIVSLCTLGLVIYLVVFKKENFTGASAWDGMGGNAESTLSATFEASPNYYQKYTEPVRYSSNTDTSSSMDTVGTLTGNVNTSGCGSSGCCSLFGGECSPGELDCRMFGSNTPCEL